MSRQMIATIVVMGVLVVGVFLLTMNSGGKPDRNKSGAPGTQPPITGTIKVELYPDKAPTTVQNFLQYVDDKHYDGTIFHRVMATFMIQGGGFTPKMVEKPTRAPIKNESTNGLSNKRGTIAMARTPDPDSATSQFFINVVDNGMLDRDQAHDGVGYCVFGKVIDGMDVVDKIKNVPVEGRAGHENVPVRDVVIKSIRREEGGDANRPVVVIEVEESTGNR